MAHELRSPAGVIAGYARMLMSGRLDETGRDEALRQLERAAGRLGDLAQQSSDLAGWIEPHDGGSDQIVAISAVIDRAAHTSAAPERVRVVGDPATSECYVRTREPRALSAAFAAVIDATAREMETRGDIAISLRRSQRAGWCDVVVGPPPVIESLRIDAGSEEGDSPFNLESGGIGLHLILGAAVIDAHGGFLWASTDVRGVTGVRLPVGAGN